jgi:NADH-quinone oxidoreductase subunit C
MPEDHGSRVLRRLLERHGAAVLETHARLGDDTALVKDAQLGEVMRFLKSDPELAFDMLMDLTCVDYLGQEPRFELVYHLYSLAKNQRLRVKARVAEGACEIESLSAVWPSANWMEREVWDLYGVRFVGHPDLRRILLYEEFQGHPLRKDYPKERRQPLVGPDN